MDRQQEEEGSDMKKEMERKRLAGKVSTRDIIDIAARHFAQLAESFPAI